jgi:hypothetical protein
VVGRGPSLLDLTAADFGPGPVFTLNHAVLTVRQLHLPNPIYSMQKDGCITPPQQPETLILSLAQSHRCFADYPRRFVINVRRLKIPTNAMSATFAVAVAHLMGCRRVRMLAMDSAKGDFRTVVGTELQTIGRGYLWAVKQATAHAATLGLEMEWI